MYPFDEDDEDEVLETEEEGDSIENEDDDVPKTFGIDFKTGQLTGGKVSGSKAVAVWVWCALMYPRYKYELTSYDYGCELQDLIGTVVPKDELESDVDAILRDTLLPYSQYIEDITNLECDLNGDQLNISFTLVTPFGEEDLEDVTIR